MSVSSCYSSNSSDQFFDVVLGSTNEESDSSSATPPASSISPSTVSEVLKNLCAYCNQQYDLVTHQPMFMAACLHEMCKECVHPNGACIECNKKSPVCPNWDLISPLKKEEVSQSTFSFQPATSSSVAPSASSSSVSPSSASRSQTPSPELERYCDVCVKAYDTRIRRPFSMSCCDLSLCQQCLPKDSCKKCKKDKPMPILDRIKLSQLIDVKATAQDSSGWAPFTKIASYV